jgi:hypothetical protein
MSEPSLRIISRLSETLFTPACDWWKSFKPGDNVTVDTGQQDPVMAMVLPDDEFVVLDSSPEGVVIGWRDSPTSAMVRLNAKKLYRVQLQHDRR